MNNISFDENDKTILMPQINYNKVFEESKIFYK